MNCVAKFTFYFWQVVQCRLNPLKFLVCFVVRDGENATFEDDIHKLLLLKLMVLMFVFKLFSTQVGSRGKRERGSKPAVLISSTRCKTYLSNVALQNTATSMLYISQHLKIFMDLRFCHQSKSPLIGCFYSKSWSTGTKPKDPATKSRCSITKPKTKLS